MLSNVVGKSCTALLAIIFIPFYLRHLGLEAWGVVGFQTTLQVVFSLLELGLPASISREIARSCALRETGFAHDLLRTSELVMAGVALFLILLLVGLAPWIATHWLGTNQLSAHTMIASVRMIGVLVGLNLVSMIYTAGLNGLSEMVWLNGITTGTAVVRQLGAWAVLALLSPTLEAFFIWQIGMAVFTAWLYRRVLRWKLGPSSAPGRFQWPVILRIWKFAAAMTTNNLIQTAAAQTDKLAVSTLLPLQRMGVYTVAGTLSTPAAMLASSVSLAAYPAMCESIAHGDMTRTRQVYMDASQWLGILVWPVAVVLCAFSRDILAVWTHNPTLAAQGHLAMSVLVVAATLGVMNQMANQLQAAFGRPRLMLLGGVTCLAFSIPLALLLIPSYGLLGAACSQLCSSLIYFLFIVPLAHHRLLPGLYTGWLRKSVFVPLAVSLAVVLPARAGLNTEATTWVPAWLSWGFLLLAIWAALGVLIGNKSLHAQRTESS